MLEAAPTAQRYRGTLFCLASVIAGITTLLFSVDHASARVQYGAGDEGTTRASLWGLALDGRQGDEPSAELLAAARNAGVNAIVTDPRRYSPARHRELIVLARKMGMLLIEPRRPSALSRDVRAQRDRCQAQRRELQACALVAKSAHEALALARRGTVDYVVVQLSSLAELARLKAAPSMRTQLIGVLTVGASPTLEADWTQAIATSAKAGRARLAVGLSGSAARTAIRDYFRLVSIHEGIAGTQAPAASTGAAATAVSADSGTDRGRGSTVDAAAAINRPGAGGGVGHDQTPPSQPGGLTANGVTTTTANLSWTASTDNVGVVGYGIYVVNGIWSPGTPLGPPVGSTKATFFTVSGLSCGSTYTLAVDAYDRAGNRSVPATKTTQTSACPSVDTQPPSVPGNLHTTSATQTSIGIAWSPSTDNVGVTGYAIYDNGSRVGQTSASSYTVSGLPCGTSHTLSVAAVDAAGNSSQQASVRARTATCSGSTDTQAPTVPGGLHVTTATTSSITVAWTASSDNVGVAGYGLYRNGTSVGTTTLLTATFSGLACGSGYTLAVDAYDAAGNRSQQASVSAPTAACPLPPPDTQAPTVPGGLHATAATTSSVTVAWTASSDNVGVAGYGLYRNATSIGTTTSLSATFSGLACGTGYTLAVDAYDTAGNRSQQASITAATSACPPPADSQAPTVPGGLHVTAATTSSVTVAWTASSDNVGVAGYGIYNGTASLGSTTSTSYTVSGLGCGTGYTIAVDAYDAAGNRSTKATVSAATSACTSTEPAPIAGQGYHKAFDDEFASLNRSTWDDHIWYDEVPHPSWLNFQTVHDGELDLMTTATDAFSGCSQLCYPLDTATTFSSGQSFQYGYFEARMRWTKGAGAWPAFWLISTGWAKTGSCTTPSGELDVFEGQGTEPNVFYGTVHKDSANRCGGDQQNGNNYQPVGVDLTAGFHTYAALWTSSQITWYLDDKPLMSAPTYSTDSQPMFLLLQMWSGGWTSDPNTSTPLALHTEVDWVRVWQK